MGKPYSAWPEHASSSDLSLEVEVKLVWIFVLPRQAVMQLLEAMPANAPLNLLEGFLFPDQDAQGLAVQRITGFQFANGEGDAEGCLAHGSNVSDFLQTQSAARFGDAPIWGHSILMRGGCREGLAGVEPRARAGAAQS
jgi:hypothetical protein